LNLAQAPGFVIAHEGRGDGAARPFGNSYWLWTGRLLAGEHPGLLGAEAMAERLAALAEAGITHFVDLTSPHDPVQPYQPLPLLLSMPEAATPPPVQRLSHPITDFGVPTVASMQAILNDVHNALDQGGKVYLHCRAGIGRTGTVAATWLVSQGLPPQQALDLLAQKWRVVDKHAQEPHSPETEAQREFVRHWLAPGI
jgi:atypical dual specificity phosphatase